MENYGPIYAALATLVAALITGSIAMVTLILGKEQKTSEFRQAWIDGLRDDLSSYFASSRTMIRALQEDAHFKKKAEKEKSQKSERITELKNISELRTGVALSSYAIKLRLNSLESDHKKLEELMAKAVDEVGGLTRKECSEAEVQQALDAVEFAASHARKILKFEWERVKEGEERYQKTVSSLKNLFQRWPVAVVLIVLVYLLLMFVRPASSEKYVEHAKNGLTCMRSGLPPTSRY